MWLRRSVLLGFVTRNLKFFEATALSLVSDSGVSQDRFVDSFVPSWRSQGRSWHRSNQHMPPGTCSPFRCKFSTYIHSSLAPYVPLFELHNSMIDLILFKVHTANFLCPPASFCLKKYGCRLLNMQAHHKRPVQQILRPTMRQLGQQLSLQDGTRE